MQAITHFIHNSHLHATEERCTVTRKRTKKKFLKKTYISCLFTSDNVDKKEMTTPHTLSF
uniref:Uncharacterized protein n=1 Tax=Anguilla anguilla TaxID=7936 RepID=A0A0E9U9J3_ANGAN